MPDNWFGKYEGLRFERRDHGVLLITINRPDAMNATDASLHKALSQIWLDIDEDDDTNVVVIPGAGRAFSAGGDLDWIGSMIQKYDSVLGFSDIILNTSCDEIRSQETNYGNFVADLVRMYFNAECSLINSGCIRAGCKL